METCSCMFSSLEETVMLEEEQVAGEESREDQESGGEGGSHVLS